MIPDFSQQNNYMAIQYNRYYGIKAAGPKAIRLTATLLQSYPVTRACLGILGNKLLERVGFGFFTEDQPFITQGEQGKDLFMLCDESVDVFVDGKKVVEMEAPVLLGDKGIVEPESLRAATISAAPEKTCFLLKIPMGLFIRNFDDMSIDDASFSQEIGIFYNMFKGIQARLFEFAFIQKNLWEEAITTQTLAKTQGLIKILDNRIDEGWGDEIWETVRVHLLDSLGFKWPDGVPLDISTFRNLLRQYLDEKYPREAYKGKDADYIRRKHQIWRKWLTSTAAIIMKGLPVEGSDIEGNKIQLFNPRNYQIRIQGLIRAIEKKFLTHKVRDLADTGNAAKDSGTESIKSFFGRTEQDNTFDLKRYLNSFERTFKLKYPKRMQTQIAQRTALVAAKCENEFNESVAAMKTMLEKSQAKLTGAYKVQIGNKENETDSDKALEPLNKAITRYYQHLDEPAIAKYGKVTYKHQSTPNFSKLLKSAGVKHVKKEILRAVQAQVKRLNISARLLTFDFIKDSFHLCQAAPGSEIASHDLERHYWMPVSQGIRLFASDNEFVEIAPGSLIGGKGWLQDASDEQGRSLGVWKLKMPETVSDAEIHQGHLVLVLPSQMFPWEINTRPNAQIFKTAYLPLMQWLINRQLNHISLHLPSRDQAFESLQKNEQILRLERKVKAFENSSVKMSSEDYQKITNFLQNTLSVALPKDKRLPSNVLAKKIYNFILKQMTIDYQRLEPEQVGNRTYTKWRMILSEIVQITEQSELERSILTSTPFFEVIENELGAILDSFNISKAKQYVQLTGQTPYLQLPQILNELDNPDGDRQLLFDLIQSTLETYLRLVIEETRFYKLKNDQAGQKRSKTDVQALQTKTILESSAKLKSIITGKQKNAGSPLVSKSA